MKFLLGRSLLQVIPCVFLRCMSGCASVCLIVVVPLKVLLEVEDGRRRHLFGHAHAGVLLLRFIDQEGVKEVEGNREANLGRNQAEERSSHGSRWKMDPRAFNLLRAFSGAEGTFRLRKPPSACTFVQRLGRRRSNSYKGRGQDGGGCCSKSRNRVMKQGPEAESGGAFCVWLEALTF